VGWIIPTDSCFLKLIAVGSGCLGDTLGTGSFMSTSDRCREIANSLAIDSTELAAGK
jgi:hypothetical protein